MTLLHQVGKIIIPLLPINRRTLNIIRFEINALLVAILNQLSPKYHLKIRDLHKKEGLNINLGSGGYGFPDWVNIDARRHHSNLSLAHDIRKPLPFKNSQAARIFAEHVLEHIDFWEDMPKVLGECYRVLQKGGRIRIIVPDGKRYLEAYVKQDPKLWEALGCPQLPTDMPTPMSMVNHVFHQGGEHLFAYDFETLEYLLKETGFINIKQVSYQEGADPKLCIDREEHAKYSLYVEAQKDWN